MEKLSGNHVNIFVKHNSKFLEYGSKNRESNFFHLAKFHKELVSRGYRVASVAAALDRARLLSRTAILAKVPRPSNQPLFSPHLMILAFLQSHKFCTEGIVP